jgi:hypothetical protein
MPMTMTTTGSFFSGVLPAATAEGAGAEAAASGVTSILGSAGVACAILFSVGAVDGVVIVAESTIGDVSPSCPQRSTRKPLINLHFPRPPHAGFRHFPRLNRGIKQVLGGLACLLNAEK